MRKLATLFGLVNILKGFTERRSDQKDLNSESSESSSEDFCDHIEFQQIPQDFPDICTDNLSKEEFALKLNAIESFLSQGNYDQALKSCTDLIKVSHQEDPYIHFIYIERASVHSKLHSWDHALEDYKKALEFSPDYTGTYLNIGANITWKYFHSGEYKVGKEHASLEEAIKYYEKSLICDPTCDTAWLNIIETYIFLLDFDGAIGKYGESEPFIKSGLWKMRRSWLGCLAMSLAGDLIEPEDIELLNEPTKYADDNHETHSIECVLSALEDSDFDPEKLENAKEIHQRYLEHFE